MRRLCLSWKDWDARQGADGRSRQDYDAERRHIWHLHGHRDGYSLLRADHLQKYGTFPVASAEELCAPDAVKLSLTRLVWSIKLTCTPGFSEWILRSDADASMPSSTWKITSSPLFSFYCFLLPFFLSGCFIIVINRETCLPMSDCFTKH